MARTRDVESWDPATGVALVVDPGEGTLKPVTAYEDFVRLERAVRVVGALAGGGWRASWVDEETAAIPQDVVGWLVTDMGGAMPLVVSSDESVEFAESADRFIAPGACASSKRGDSGERWKPLVVAERETARIRAEVNQLPARTEILERELNSGSAWERSTALTFLRLLPEDVPGLLEELVDLCLSTGWAQPAREALWAARHDIEMPVLGEVVLRKLADGDAEDHRMLADMLTYVEAWSVLGEVIGRASQSEHAEVRRVGEEFLRSYGGLLP